MKKTLLFFVSFVAMSSMVVSSDKSVKKLRKEVDIYCQEVDRVVEFTNAGRHNEYSVDVSDLEQALDRMQKKAEKLVLGLMGVGKQDAKRAKPLTLVKKYNEQSCALKEGNNIVIAIARQQDRLRGIILNQNWAAQGTK